MDIETIAKGLTEVQQMAILGAVDFCGLGMALTDEFEDHPDIIDGLSEEIADCISGDLTPLGLAVRAHLQESQS